MATSKSLNKQYLNTLGTILITIIVCAIVFFVVDFINNESFETINDDASIVNYETVDDSSVKNNLEINTALEGNNNLNNKIIYNASVNLKTTNFEQTLSSVNNIIADNDIILIDDDYNIRNNERVESFTLKVKASELDSVLNKFKELGNVLSFNKEATNVTEQYVDIEKRISSLENQLEKFYLLLDEATNVSDISNIYILK